MNLADAFAACAGKHAQKTAIYYGEREISFAELHAQSLKFSAHLQSRFAVTPGDRVGLWLKNCPEFVVAVFGILQAGAVVVPINNFLKPAELAYPLNDAGIDVLITNAELGANAEELKRRDHRSRFSRLKNCPVSQPSTLNFQLPRLAASRIWP